jgi:hypothetical protein
MFRRDKAERFMRRLALFTALWLIPACAPMENITMDGKNRLFGNCSETLAFAPKTIHSSSILYPCVLYKNLTRAFFAVDVSGKLTIHDAAIEIVHSLPANLVSV